MTVKRSLLAIAGAGLGFAYYYFIGCTGGSCPIQSNPYVSAIYGGVVGLLLSDVIAPRQRKNTSPDQHSSRDECQTDQQGYESGKFRT
jgi:hypothetical protein